MDNSSNEITLGQLFKTARKAFKRALLYILATALVTSVVLSCVKSFTDVKCYSTTISFLNAGEDTLSRLNSKKSIIVDKAMADKNDPALNTEVLSNLSVSAYETDSDKKEDKDYISTSFVISLRTSDNLPFSSGDYKNVVDNIANEYVKSFSDGTLQSISFELSDSFLKTSEYMEQALELSQIVSDYVQLLSEEISSFKELDGFIYETANLNRKTINDVLYEFNSAKTLLSGIVNKIVTNKLEKTDNGLSAYLTLNRDIAKSSISAISAQQEAILNAIEAYKNTFGSIQSGSIGSTIINIDNSIFAQLSQQSLNIAKSLGAANQKFESLQTYIDYIDNTTTTDGVSTPLPDSLKHTFPDKNSDAYKLLIEEIGGAEGKNGLIKTVFNSIKTSVSDYNGFAKEFNAAHASSTDIVRLDSAHTVVEGIISVKIIVLIEFCAILIAYIAAYSQTSAKMKAQTKDEIKF